MKMLRLDEELGNAIDDLVTTERMSEEEYNEKYPPKDEVPKDWKPDWRWEE